MVCNKVYLSLFSYDILPFFSQLSVKIYFMELVNVILVGAIIGALADLLYPGSYRKLLGPIILGSLGALCGSVLATLIFGQIDKNIFLNNNFITVAAAFLIVLLSKAYK